MCPWGQGGQTLWEGERTAGCREPEDEQSQESEDSEQSEVLG